MTLPFTPVFGSMYYLSNMEGDEIRNKLDPTFNVATINVRLSYEHRRITSPLFPIYEALIDTGSTYCVANRDLLEQSGFKKSGTKKVFSYQDGEELEKDAYVGCVYLEGNGVMCDVEFLANETGKSYPVVLGANFLLHFQFKFDGKNREYTLKHNNFV